jgi:hypothetical protein
MAKPDNRSTPSPVNPLEEKPTKKSPAHLAAEQLLSPELHSTLEQMLNEYKFAAFKCHGTAFVSPRVIAELILMGWRSLPSNHPALTTDRPKR